MRATFKKTDPSWFGKRVSSVLYDASLLCSRRAADRARAVALASHCCNRVASRLHAIDCFPEPSGTAFKVGPLRESAAPCTPSTTRFYARLPSHAPQRRVTLAPLQGTWALTSPLKRLRRATTVTKARQRRPRRSSPRTRRSPARPRAAPTSRATTGCSAARRSSWGRTSGSRRRRSAPATATTLGSVPGTFSASALADAAPAADDGLRRRFRRGLGADGLDAVAERPGAGAVPGRRRHRELRRRRARTSLECAEA